METRRQRTRILLRAAIGAVAGKEKGRPRHHKLQLSDGSETSDSPANESDMIASLSGSGAHYDRTTVGVPPTTRKLQPIRSSPTTSTNTTKLRTIQSSPTLKRNTVVVPPGHANSSSCSIEKITDVVTETVPTSVTTTTAAGSDMPCPSPKTSPPPGPPPITSLASSVPSIVDSAEMVPVADSFNVEAAPIPTLETTNASGSETDEISSSVADKQTTRAHPLATASEILHNSTNFLPHPRTSSKSRVLSSESEPKVHAVRRRQKAPPPKIPPSRSSTDSSASPRSIFKTDGTSDVSDPQRPPRSRPMKNKPPRATRPKRGRNQVHPESCGVSGGAGVEQPPQRPLRQRVSEPQQILHQVSRPKRTSVSQQVIQRVCVSPELSNHDAVDGSSSIARSFSPISTGSIHSRPSSSLLETGRSSTSVLTPLRTCSLRLHSLPLEGKWDLGGESQLESFFPDRHIRMYIVTWNMQEIRDLPASLDDLLLPLSHDMAADMYVIGTQESTPCRREWELLLQKTLGPFYVMVQSSSIGVIYLCFFMRRDLIWFCSATTSANFATRPVNIIKTKGAVGISFTLFGSSFLFITSHFTASSHKVAERNADMHKIATNLTLCDDVPTGGFSGDVTSKFDYVFWFGDLNYRVEMTRLAADRCLRRNDIMSLLLRDQLTREILQGNAFLGFSEQPISFPPSYKFDPDTDEYDTSEKQRVPSWTDRILFKSRSGDGIVGCGYTSCESLRCSDHKPVCGVFRVRLDASHHVEGVPSSVAGYDREVYMRANKQRSIILAVARASEEMDDTRSPTPSRKGHAERRGAVTSQVCTIL